MQLASTIPLVTGANRGLGRNLVEALLERGVSRVYAAARDPRSLDALVARSSGRVVAIELDVTKPATIAAAAAGATDVRLLVNNAGTAVFTSPLDADREALEQELATNYLGTLEMTRAFVPVLERNGGGAIVNILSMLSLGSLAGMAGYSASKAAAHSITQALRPGLGRLGISVHGVYPAGIDTDMLAGMDISKAPPLEVADAILDGLEKDQEDIFPDPGSQQMSQTWSTDPKSLERMLASMA